MTAHANLFPARLLSASNLVTRPNWGPDQIQLLARESLKARQGQDKPSIVMTHHIREFTAPPDGTTMGQHPTRGTVPMCSTRETGGTWRFFLWSLATPGRNKRRGHFPNELTANPVAYVVRPRSTTNGWRAELTESSMSLRTRTLRTPNIPAIRGERLDVSWKI